MNEPNLVSGRSPMDWLRIGAVALCAVLCISALVEQSELPDRYPPGLVVVAFAA
ncbi:MAG: hypothetical protein K2X03_00265 [Bryobacteraceae bacterium]|nr:hypothetical protein [Bryobacteraceae bacterium]